MKMEDMIAILEDASTVYEMLSTHKDFLDLHKDFDNMAFELTVDIDVLTEWLLDEEEGES